jgi:hypothetical protein
MKKFLLIFALAFSVPFFAGCPSVPAPTERVKQVQTLKAVGHTAEAAVSSSAQLYAAKLITDKQARDIADLYNDKFQPLYRVAVNAVNANLDSIASPELAGLAAQLAAIVAQYQAKP